MTHLTKLRGNPMRWFRRKDGHAPESGESAREQPPCETSASSPCNRDEAVTEGKAGRVQRWIQGLWKKHDLSVEDTAADRTAQDQEDRFAAAWIGRVLCRSEALPNAQGEAAPSAADSSCDGREGESEPSEQEVEQTRSRLAQAFVAGIRKISDQGDRDDVLHWFVDARDVLDSGRSQKEIAKDLYTMVDSKRMGKLIANMAVTTVRNYKDSDLPLSMKVALPVTAVGAAIFGLQGAGLAAFGGAIGVPVVLLLFLGTAGVAAIIEALVKDKSSMEPVTCLVITLLALEQARRLRKDLAVALREDAEVPRRAETSGRGKALLDELRAMDPFDFERHVMWLCEKRLGHPAGVTRKSRDNGFDGYVAHPDGLIIVQCKRYNADNAVGSPEIQQFKGVIEEQEAARGYFVTTGRFTHAAQESASRSDKVILVDCDELVAWHDNEGP